MDANTSFSDLIQNLPVDNNIQPNHEELKIVENIFPAPTWYQKFDRNKHLIIIFALIVIGFQPKMQNLFLSVIQKIPISYTKNINEKSIIFHILLAIIIILSYISLKNKLF